MDTKQLEELMRFELGRSGSVMEIRPLQQMERLRQTHVRLLNIKTLRHRGEGLAPLDLELFFSSLHGLGQRVVVLLRNTPQEVALTLGIILKEEDSSSLRPHELGKAVEHIIQARFPGSDTDWLPWERIENLSVSLQKLPCIGALVGLPSLRDENQTFSSVIGEMLYALADIEFAFLMIADPLSGFELAKELEVSQNLLEEVQAKTQKESQKTYENSRSKIGKTSFDTEESKNKTSTEFDSFAKNETSSKSGSLGFSPNLSFGGVSFSLGGVSGSYEKSETSGSSLGRSFATSSIQRSSHSSHDELLDLERQTIVERQIFQDVRAQTASDLLRAECERLLYAGSVGAWNVGTYILGENPLTLQTAAQLMRGSLSGRNSIQRPLRLVELKSQTEASERLRSMQQIELTDPALRGVLQTIMNSRDLGLAACLPTQSVPGIEVRQAHAFGQWSPSVDEHEPVFRLGCMVSYGRKLGKRDISLNLNDLTMHGLVTGSTGSGKTHTVMRLLRSAWKEHEIPFLVIDPKEEYKQTLRSYLPDIRIIDVSQQNYKFNPFVVPEGRSIVSYAEQLKNVFCASFETEAAMPELILQAILEIYKKRGWNLRENLRRECKYDPFPTLTDLQQEISHTISRNQFEGTLRSNYRSALGSRIRSLRTGWKADLLDGKEENGQGLEPLLVRPAIIDTGQMDPLSRSFLMALLLLRLSNIRRYQQGTRELRHILVLEEAHQLLRHPSSLGGALSAGRLQALEALLEAIAELRAFGQGILLVEQSPQELHPAVLRGTNLKIVHKLIEGRDQDAALEALGLPLGVRDTLGNLPRGHAVVRGAGWANAVEVCVESLF